MQTLPHEIRMELEAVWKYLIDLNIANPVDRGAFNRYITPRKMQGEAETDLAERGIIIRKGTARERFNPFFRVLQTTLAELWRGYCIMGCQKLSRAVKAKAPGFGPGAVSQRFFSKVFTSLIIKVAPRRGLEPRT